MNGEILYQDRDITITRLDEHRVILRTIPRWYNYLALGLLVLFCGAFMAVSVFGFISISEDAARGEFNTWYGLVGAFLVVFFMFAFPAGILWTAAYHVLAKSFMVDSDAKKCMQDYSLFFKRAIPFEEIESFETEEVHSPKSSRYAFALYLIRSKWPWRVCVFQTSRSTTKGASEAAHILKEEIEKSHKLPTGVELKKRRRTPVRRITNIGQWAIAIPMVAALLLFLVVLPPVETVWATVNLLQMRSSTTGTIIKAPAGDDGQAKPTVRYRYAVGGREYESTRFVPGLLMDYVEDTRDRLRDMKYAVGQRVTVYYNASNPSQARLKYGWPFLAVGFSFFVWGMLLTGYGQWRKKENRKYWVIFSSLGPALLILGFGEVAAGGGDADGVAINVSEIHWHLMIFGVLFVSSLTYQAFRKKKKRGKQTEQAD
jgi:hypothetical protein